jgi:hypothetical protein
MKIEWRTSAVIRTHKTHLQDGLTPIKKVKDENDLIRLKAKNVRKNLKLFILTSGCITGNVKNLNSPEKN